MPPVAALRARPILAAVLALGLAAGIGAAAAPAAAADDAVTEITAETTRVVAATREPLLRGGDAELQVDVLIDNTSEQRLPEGTAELALDPRPLESVEDLGGVFPEHPVELGETRFGVTAAGEQQTLTIPVPRDRLPFTAATPSGVYLLRVALAPGVAVTAPLVWEGSGSASRDGAAGEVRLGLIVPLVLPDEVRTLPTRSQLEELTPRWTELLDQARAAQATLAIDPRVVAGIRAYGDEAPEPARQFLARLEASPLSSFLLQFADADPSAQADLGFTALLQPTSLDFVSRFGGFEERAEGSGGGADSPVDAPGDGLAADGNAAADATDTEASGDGDAGRQTDADAADPGSGSTLPGLDELLRWDAGAPMAWPAEGSVDQGTLELLRRSNIDSFVLDSDNVDRANGGPRVTLEQGSALITDAALGDAARTALSARSEVERSAGASLLAAQLLLAGRSGSEDLILGLDRGAVGEAEDPARLVEQLRALDWVTPAPVSELATGTALLRGADTLEDRRELLRAAVARESSVTELGAALVHPEYLSGYQRTRLLELFATRHAAPEGAFEEVAAHYRERDAELLQGIQAVTSERVQLVGASSRVPVQLHNSLPFEALVDVQAVPASAALAVDEPRFTAVEVPAEGNERVLVPINSRVSSGESGLVVTVTAPSGDLTVFTGTLPISIRSGVETAALSVFAALAALLLGFGIWRSIRRRRRTATTGAGTGAALAGAGAATTADERGADRAE